MHNHGNQNIACTVTSCKYNENAHDCTLKDILVAPDAGSAQVQSAEQSMCSSFKHR